MNRLSGACVAKYRVVACLLAGGSIVTAAAAVAQERLEEVVVTATKRSDPISKVPISVAESTSPFFSMWVMVTRKTRGGELNGPGEAISIREAIRAYTINGAYSGFEERTKGSVERGKLADLNVLSADPLSVPPDQIKDIKVLTTVLDGKIVATSTH